MVFVTEVGWIRFRGSQRNFAVLRSDSADRRVNEGAGIYKTPPPNKPRGLFMVVQESDLICSKSFFQDKKSLSYYFF